MMKTFIWVFTSITAIAFVVQAYYHHDWGLYSHAIWPPLWALAITQGPLFRRRA